MLVVTQATRGMIKGECYEHYDEGIKEGACLMEKVRACLTVWRSRYSLEDSRETILRAAPSCSSFNSHYGFAECDSGECFEDGGDNGAILSSWPCSVVQPILSGV